MVRLTTKLERCTSRLSVKVELHRFCLEDCKVGLDVEGVRRSRVLYGGRTWIKGGAMWGEGKVIV